jgi:hypothetical protein
MQKDFSFCRKTFAASEYNIEYFQEGRWKTRIPGITSLAGAERQNLQSRVIQ